MSRQKARFCDECVYFRGCPLGKPRPPCIKGHSPRFYMPRTTLDQRWGWKRACTDFTTSKADQ